MIRRPRSKASKEPVTRVIGKVAALKHLDKLKRTVGLLKGKNSSVRFVRKIRREWD